MPGEISAPAKAVRRRKLSPNRIFLPRGLRDAIPDLPTCLGRELAVDSIQGRPANGLWFGERVQLDVVAKETGKLTGEFTVRIELDPEAARMLAATLLDLANRAEGKSAAP